jgi:hypothetical protein
MGITTQSLNRINRYLKPESKILIIGCQNLYNEDNYGEIAHTYFKALGHYVKSIDILGCNGSEVADLRDDLGFKPEYDMVNDCGSKEHIAGELYQPFLNMHKACKIGGVIIHENPRFGHWPLHGQHYFSMGFYNKLAELAGYDLLEVCEEAAMSNYDSGMNVCSVLRKNHKSFISEMVFNALYNETIFKS